MDVRAWPASWKGANFACDSQIFSVPELSEAPPSLLTLSDTHATSDQLKRSFVHAVCMQCGRVSH